MRLANRTTYLVVVVLLGGVAAMSLRAWDCQDHSKRRAWFADRQGALREFGTHILAHLESHPVHPAASQSDLISTGVASETDFSFTDPNSGVVVTRTFRPIAQVDRKRKLVVVIEQYDHPKIFELLNTDPESKGANVFLEDGRVLWYSNLETIFSKDDGERREIAEATLSP